jgi:ABC-type transporter Mla MlaB component
VKAIAGPPRLRVHAARPLRRPSALFDLLYCIGELTQSRADGIEKAHDRVPANATTTTLDLRDIGRVDVETTGQLVLRQLRALAQHLERLAEHPLVVSRVSQLSTFSHVGLSWWRSQHSAPAPLATAGGVAPKTKASARGARYPSVHRRSLASARGLRRFLPRRNRR